MHLGFHIRLKQTNYIKPIGFHVFPSISYTISLYKNQQKSMDSLMPFFFSKPLRCVVWCGAVGTPCWGCRLQPWMSLNQQLGIYLDSRVIPGTFNNGTPNNGKFPILFPNPTPIRIPKDMGIVWETYHKQFPLLKVPENPTDRWVHGKGWPSRSAKQHPRWFFFNNIENRAWRYNFPRENLVWYQFVTFSGLYQTIRGNWYIQC